MALWGSRAIELACDIRLHHSFVLPPNRDRQRHRALRVSYADLGHDGSVSAGEEEQYDAKTAPPVILWAGGMFGGRYQACAYDDLCKKYHVRFIAVDRPGIGGTDSVPLDQRIGVWLDLVPALMKHLGIKHVHLAAHSAGTIYVLNTALHQRHLLYPHHASVALFGPWVHPSKSGHVGLSVVGMLPALAIGTWHHWATLAHNNIAPVFKALDISVTKRLTDTSDQIEVVDDTDGNSTPEHTAEVARRRALETVLTSYIYAENMEGAGQEALLCLRKGNVDWGGWKHIEEALLQIAEAERKNSQAKREGERNLTFRTYFAEADEMIGKKGSQWLKSCFTKADVASVIDFDSQVVPNSDHNDVLAIEHGAVENMVSQLGCSPDRRNVGEG